LKLAHETGARLEAAAAWELTYGGIDGYWPDIERRSKEAAAAALELLDKAIAAATQDLPESAETIRTGVEGQPPRCCFDRSKGADLLVVGSRGRGGFTGLSLDPSAAMRPPRQGSGRRRTST